MVGLRAVVFDWRGTLTTTLGAKEWVGAALGLLGRDDGAESVTEVWDAISRAPGQPGRFGAVGVDSDAAVHRDVYYEVFADAGLDGELADALYAVESDPSYNPFAVDAADVIRAVASYGCKVAILSDIHFDLRPVFATVGLTQVIDAFVLSFEHGVQKPAPAIFRVALDELGTDPSVTLMVGDRPSHDGAAINLGMPTLLVPRLTDVHQRRLHLVQNLVRPPGNS